MFFDLRDDTCGCLSCKSIDDIKQRRRELSFFFCVNHKDRSEDGKRQKRKEEEKKNLGWIEDSDSG